MKETWDDLYPWFHQHLGAWHNETDPRWKEAQIAGMNEDLTAGRRICLLGFDRSDHSLAVSTGFPNIDWVARRFEVDYWVVQSHQRRGFAQEAVNGLLRFAFCALSAREVTLSHADGNQASATIAARLEFGRVSTVQRAIRCQTGVKSPGTSTSGPGRKVCYPSNVRGTRSKPNQENVPWSAKQRKRSFGTARNGTMSDRFVVLSGCSGGGKSTLLDELRSRGHATIEEPGRRIVKAESAHGGTALPWIDLAAFAQRASEVWSAAGSVDTALG